MGQAHSISFVIPVYNEEGNIRNTLRAALATFPKICADFELIVVESGSTDGSLAIIREEAEQNEHIVLIHQGKKEGMGSALRAGYGAARKEWVAHLEADQPFDLGDISLAIPYLDDYDFIRGYRTGEDGDTKNWIYSNALLKTAVRLGFHYGYNLLIRALFGFSVSDINFSFKLIRSALVKNRDLRTKGWFIDTELVLELRKARARMKEIPIRYCVRNRGRSTVTPVSPFPILADAVRYRLTRWRSGQQESVTEKEARHPL